MDQMVYTIRMFSGKTKTAMLFTLSLVGAGLYVAQFWPIGAFFIGQGQNLDNKEPHFEQNQTQAGLSWNSEFPKALSGENIFLYTKSIVEFGPRYPTAAGHEETIKYIISLGKQFAHEVRTQTWVHKERAGGSYELTNIIFRYDPDNEQRIILGTHYDTFKFAFKDRNNRSDLPTPGANNGASGVGVLLGIAEALHGAYLSPTVGIDIVFFDGEEGDESARGDFSYWMPHGSTHFADALADIYSIRPVGAVVLDMVCEKNARFLKEISSLYYAKEQVEFFWKNSKDIRGDMFPDQPTTAVSDDHTPLNNVGIPSLLVIDLDYPHYATTEDTIDKCDP
jgi:glutaminyl-peptide cyclotransferase